MELSDVVNRLLPVLQASKSSFIARSLLAYIGMSLALLPVGWPDDYLLSDGEHFDIVVVGSGSAGAIVAARMAEVPSLRVLLLEAGLNPPANSVIPGLFATLGGTKYDFKYTAKQTNGVGNARTQRDIPYQRGKVLGGCSSVNYLVYTRGVPEDYDNWNLTAPGWAWSDVLYYFKKFEDMRDPSVFTPDNSYLHSTGGPIQVSRPDENPISAHANKIILDSYCEIGIPTVLESNGRFPCGATLPHFTFANGTRSSTAQGFLRYINEIKPNLRVAKNSRATKLIIDPENLQANGVEVLLSNGNKLNVFASKEVIVSGGSIDSPKLLMLSGIGPRILLDRVGIQTIVDLPVGQNLQDHVYVPLTIAGKRGILSAISNLLIPTQVNSFPLPFQTSLFKLNNTSSRNMTQPQFQTFNLYVGAGASLLVKFACESYGYIEQVCTSISNANLDREIFHILVTILHEKSRGNVSVVSNNAMDNPNIELGFLSEEQDLDDLRDGLKFIMKLVNTSYFAQNDAYIVKLDLPECNNIVYGSDEYLNCYIRNLVSPMLHAAGTCSLNAVVDERLRVRGISHLRVVDASVMPTMPSGNTNAPSMMIGEKAADMIKQDQNITTY